MEPSVLFITEKVQEPIVAGVVGTCNFEESVANNPGDDMAKMDSKRHLVFSLRVTNERFFVIYYLKEANKYLKLLESSHGENLLDHLVGGRGQP